MNTFGNRLRAARAAHGMTQEAVGFEAGVTNATVSKWETGRSEPTLDQLAALATLLGRSTDYFLRPAVTAGDARAVWTLSDDEEKLLIQFRTLSPVKRQGILTLMVPDE
jgi:transcriptional regulator with XRE-family HTH domain